jgi:hypothetical protein
MPPAPDAPGLGAPPLGPSLPPSTFVGAVGRGLVGTVDDALAVPFRAFVNVEFPDTVLFPEGAGVAAAGVMVRTTLEVMVVRTLFGPKTAVVTSDVVSWTV